jgi:hypothetical protein
MPSYNPRMRIAVFTALAACLLVSSAVAQSASQSVLRADRVVVLKKERTLQLVNQGSVIKTFRLH